MTPEEFNDLRGTLHSLLSVATLHLEDAAKLLEGKKEMLNAGQRRALMSIFSQKIQARMDALTRVWAVIKPTEATVF